MWEVSEEGKVLEHYRYQLYKTLKQTNIIWRSWKQLADWLSHLVRRVCGTSWISHIHTLHLLWLEKQRIEHKPSTDISIMRNYHYAETSCYRQIFNTGSFPLVSMWCKQVYQIPWHLSVYQWNKKKYSLSILGYEPPSVMFFDNFPTPYNYGPKNNPMRLANLLLLSDVIRWLCIGI